MTAAVSTSAQTTAPPIEGTTTKLEGLPLAETIAGAVNPVAPPRVAEAINLATRLAVGTAPFGVSSGGFLLKLDPNTGLQVRAATTFGPSFTERALTSGEGAVSVGVSYMYSSYARLGSQGFEGVLLQSTPGATPAAAREGRSDLTLVANTMVVAARAGITDTLDVGVNLPIVKIEVGGSTSLFDGTGRTLTYAAAKGSQAGLGDLAAIVKYRFYSLGTGLPDPGGMAVMFTMRLPTGDTDNLRGLGVTRAKGELIYSSGQKRFRPHANVGFEWWSKGVSATSAATNDLVTARHQLEYAAGLELEAAPKCTLLLDFLGGQIFGGGRVDVQTAGSSSVLTALPEGLTRFSLAPGVKVNVKGKMLLAVNALIALKDDGLHARVTPVAGLEMSF